MNFQGPWQIGSWKGRAQRHDTARRSHVVPRPDTARGALARTIGQLCEAGGHCRALGTAGHWALPGTRHCRAPGTNQSLQVETALGSDRWLTNCRSSSRVHQEISRSQSSLSCGLLSSQVLIPILVWIISLHYVGCLARCSFTTGTSVS